MISVKKIFENSIVVVYQSKAGMLLVVGYRENQPEQYEKVIRINPEFSNAFVIDVLCQLPSEFTKIDFYEKMHEMRRKGPCSRILFRLLKAYGCTYKYNGGWHKTATFSNPYFTEEAT